MHGLSRYRNDVRIQGVGMTSDGSNWMDLPLHYALAAIVDDASVTRGVVSLAVGIDNLLARATATYNRVDGSDIGVCPVRLQTPMRA